jgi:hypothetical protein
MKGAPFLSFMRNEALILCGNGGNKMPSLSTQLHVISAGNSPPTWLVQQDEDRNKLKI